jgi:hypothetical protein
MGYKKCCKYGPNSLAAKLGSQLPFQLALRHFMEYLFIERRFMERHFMEFWFKELTSCYPAQFMCKRSAAHDRLGEARVVGTPHSCMVTLPKKEGGIQVLVVLLHLAIQ